MNLNQKQREYLTKRLQKLAEEKKASFRVEDPNPEPFIKKLKVISPDKLVEHFKKAFTVSNRKESGRYEGRGYSNYVEGKRIIGLSINSSCDIKDKYYFTNMEEVQKEYGEFCKKYYKVYDDRLASIDTECQRHCDMIVFSESYEEALKVIEQFTKF